jgi:hypothetical protein
MVPSDIISSLSRTSVLADTDLVASRVSGMTKKLVTAVGLPAWEPPAAVKNAISDGLLLGTGAGTGWQIQTGGDSGHLTLTLQCGESQKKTGESVVIIRSLLPGLWKISHKPGFSESTYSSLAALIHDFRKLEQTRLLSPCLEDSSMQMPKVTTYLWLGARFLGSDGLPDSITICPGLVERNQRALAVHDKAHSDKNLKLARLAQPHLRLWNLNGSYIVGSVVDTNIYFLCSIHSVVAYCSFSVEDIFEQALLEA